MLGFLPQPQKRGSSSSSMVVHGFVRVANCSPPHSTTSTSTTLRNSLVRNNNVIIASITSWRKAASTTTTTESTTIASTSFSSLWTTTNAKRRTSSQERLSSLLVGSPSSRRTLFSSSSCLKSTTNPPSDIPSSETLSEKDLDLDKVKELREQRKEERKAKRLKARQEKKRRSRSRREFIGQAKAVDRGQFDTIYNPRHGPSRTFVAQSGLPSRKPFTVLGIESSCDDTGAAVVRSDGVILGEALKSQSSIHEPFGGVVPNLAREAHLEAIDNVVDLALTRANVTVDQLDAIGVTVGPGLEICLRVGFRKAQELAIQYQKPFVGVHHLEAHILMARFASLSTAESLEFPFLALLVSGGHCQLLKCLGIGQYEMLGGTLDDSLGEAFDKVARLLELKCVGGGGGPAIEELAKQGDPTKFPLTIPMQHRADLDFSFSGLKTSVRTSMAKLIQERKRCHETSSKNQEESSNETKTTSSSLDLSVLSQDDKANIAAGFQHTAILHVEQRLKRCLDKLQETDSSTQIKQLAVVGGVAANQALRKRLETLCESYGIQMMVPPPRLCTDQGTMSAWATIERLHLGSSDDPLTQDVYARYPFCNTILQDDKDAQRK